MAREIPAVEIASLRLQDDGNDKDCLVPEDWRVAHGSNWNNLRGFRNVRVFRDDVLRAFPAEVSNVSDAGNGNERIEGPPGLPRISEAGNARRMSGHPRPEQPQQPRVAHRRRVNERLVPFKHFIQTVFLIRPPCRMRSCAGASAIGSKSKSCPSVSDATILRAADRRK